MSDYTNQIMSNSVTEIRVEVNQRHLIDKMLARYAAEFVVFRELMQNADDAKTTAVEIIFEGSTDGTLTKTIFKNNGFHFRGQDWNRLKKIAEGNPDEQKIGAFGVGFYSLFSVCENPKVSSGGLMMEFFWRGDQLYARHGPDGSKNLQWTAFEMEMRTPGKFPNVDSFSRFLATSLGFTGNLCEASVYFNKDRVIHITKKIGQPQSIEIRSDINNESPKGIFKLLSADLCNVQIDARKVCIPPGTLPSGNCPVEVASVCLQIASGNMAVRVPDDFCDEMERLTKKKPPKQTKIHVLLPKYNDSTMDKSSNIFKDLLPFPEQGRIFIGFQTHQTTGCSVHVAARVIPTVERESIDLVDPTLSIYNSEMLCSAGILSRLLYENEMCQISNLYQNAISTQKSTFDCEKRAAHVLAHFTFRNSTPNFKVSEIIEPQFFNCCSSKLSILSTNGVKAINKIRIPDPEMAAFTKTVSVVPEIVFERCDLFFNRAETVLKLIEKASINDAFDELKSRTLNQEEMEAAMRWWISYSIKQNVTNLGHDRFAQYAVVRDGISALPLKNIRYFLNIKIIPPESDIPPDVLPYSISKTFKLIELKKYFGNWVELPLGVWAKYILKKYKIENDSSFAEKFIGILSQGYKSMDGESRTTICKLLSQKSCIPTQFGLKRPIDTYFPEVTLFEDLPRFSMKNISEDFFLGMGVHKHVELQLVFNRMVNNENLDHMKLVEYFASISKSLKNDDIEKLKTTAIWVEENANLNKPKTKIRRYLAKNLYAPSPMNRMLRLPIIYWKGNWIGNSDEVNFMITLGLQEYPSLQAILRLASPPTVPQIREKALNYFIDNLREKYREYRAALIQDEFLPCDNTGVYTKPSDCFSNPDCMIMGFNTLRKDLRIRAEELGVRQHPNGKQLLKRLSNNLPNSIDEAKMCFDYLSSRRGDFDHEDWKVLRSLEFIPIQDNSMSGKITHYSPKDCFLNCSNENYANILPNVDFGEVANIFLENCGVKREPSSLDLAEYLVRSSKDCWSRMDEDSYVSILGTIAFNYPSIFKEKPTLYEEMKQSPILLGRKKYGNSERYELACANEIFINDNDRYRDMFNALTCQFKDQKMEEFYRVLGCQTLSSNVKSTPEPEGTPVSSQISDEVLEKIQERVPWYYSSIPNDNIKCEVTWVENLKVMEVDRIYVTYELTTNKMIKKEEVSSSISENENTYILYISRTTTDFTDIASNLILHIHQRPQRQHSLTLYTYLTSQIDVLQRLGYPIEKTKKASKGRAPETRTATMEPPTKIRKTDPSAPIPNNELQNLLRGGIMSCRSNFQDSVYSPPTVNSVPESRCDSVPETSLKYVKTEGEIELHVASNMDPSSILSPTMTRALKSFIKVLVNVAEIFDIQRNKLNIFYDLDSTTVAFNRNRTLFFNLKYYIEFKEPYNKALISWFMTFCHELAHNFVQLHSAEHEFFLQSYAKTYIPKLFEKMGGGNPGTSGGGAGQSVTSRTTTLYNPYA
ncbi:10501_t:CDS:10 [Dentiscutata erythropus]|uniref:10501_t:CDS:1 n=1 Tax=Dentiscutata erythropus TaxID=1348616 RepID=A0A9N8ZEY7_9GLOM|nr:10501_t:CDS:10 [Dentiscutata erythropus]